MVSPNGIELCVVFARTPEFKYLATLRSIDDAKMFVEERLAALAMRVKMTGRESTAMQLWLAAEATVLTIPNEKHLLFPEGWTE